MEYVIKINGKRNLITLIESEAGHWYAERYEVSSDDHPRGREWLSVDTSATPLALRNKIATGNIKWQEM